MRYVEIKIPVQLMREGERVLLYSPALDVCGYGSNPEEARKDFDGAVKVFFEETASHRTLDKALEELGWKKVTVDHKSHWEPQIEIINTSSQEIRVPA